MSNGIRRAIQDALSEHWNADPVEAYNADPSVSLRGMLMEHGWTEPDEDEAEILGDLMFAPDGTTHRVTPELAMMPSGWWTKWDAFRELVAKGDAGVGRKKLRAMGYGNGDAQLVLPDPLQRTDVAEKLLEGLRDEETGYLTVRYWHDTYWLWNGSRYVEWEEVEVRAMVARVTQKAVYVVMTEEGPKQISFSQVNKTISEIATAFKYLTILPAETTENSCVEGYGCVGRGATVIPMRNGLLQVGKKRGDRKLLPCTPAYFNLSAIPFDYDEGAEDPVEWMTFLKEVMEDEADRRMLGQWFGYVVSGRTDLQKALLLEGPPRAGKTIIMNVMTAIAGAANTHASNAHSLSGSFGLEPLVGKTLCTLGDAYFGKDVGIFVERFKEIVGEGEVGVEVKYKKGRGMKLGVRFAIASNGMPKFTDASTASVVRLLVIRFTKSFAGREDILLPSRIMKELSGILNWALDGLDDLREVGRFSESHNSVEARAELSETASPALRFLRQKMKPGGSILAEDVWEAWVDWCDEARERPGTQDSMGRVIRSALSSPLLLDAGWVVERKKLREEGKRPYWYLGMSMQ